MRTGVLNGRDHHEIGAVAAISEGPAAIALSRGGARKRYTHTEANEDAAGFAIAEVGALAVVADGHFGAYGAEIAVARTLDHATSEWLSTAAPTTDPARWLDEILGLMLAIDHAILARSRDRGLLPAPTTLSLAVARLDANCWWHASMGDSHVFRVGSRGAEDVGFHAQTGRPPSFVGDGFATRVDLSDRVAVGCEEIGGLRALVLATDGLSEKGIGVDDPAAEVGEVADRAADVPREIRALEISRGVVETSLAAHRRRRSGDNAAAAAIWLSADPA